MEDYMKPNIFYYATSELSQDAFFCWLIEWSRKEYMNEQMNRISLNFLNHIFEKTNKEKIDAVNQLEIIRQEANIDFYAKVNNTAIILFEDKTLTDEHDNQLIKYKQYIEKRYKNFQLSYVYLKSSIIHRSEKEVVNNSGYCLLDIYDLINLLQIESNNELFDSYVQMLSTKIGIYNSYHTLPFSQWMNKAETWLGLYAHLEKNIDGSTIRNWGGSLKTWLELSYCWNGEYEIDEPIELIVALDRNKVVISGSIDEKTDIDVYRDFIFEKIETSELGNTSDLRFSKDQETKKSIRIATIENVLILDDNGIVDFEKTINKITKIIQRVHECFAEKK
jgi:hypothetical protein